MAVIGVLDRHGGLLQHRHRVDPPGGRQQIGELGLEGLLAAFVDDDFGGPLTRLEDEPADAGSCLVHWVHLDLLDAFGERARDEPELVVCPGWETDVVVLGPETAGEGDYLVLAEAEGLYPGVCDAVFGLPAQSEAVLAGPPQVRLGVTDGHRDLARPRPNWIGGRYVVNDHARSGEVSGAGEHLDRVLPGGVLAAGEV